MWESTFAIQLESERAEGGKRWQGQDAEYAPLLLAPHLLVETGYEPFGAWWDTHPTDNS